ncbi:MAG: hypothetical protein ACYC2H_11800 [Thermoplasmatota archaeon]
MGARKAMHKDSNLRKRNALVIPGGLLALYSLIGLLYVVLIRGNEGTCADPGLMVFAGACRSATLLLAIPLVIGLALVGVGALAFRNKSHCRSGHGSWTHFGLAFLLSVTLVGLLGFLAAPSLVGEDAVITRGTVDYPVSTVFAGLTALGVLMLVPFVVLYAAQTRANPCCREKGCFEPCFCDEPAAEEPVPEPAPEPAPATLPEAAPLTPAPEPVAPVPAAVQPDPAASTWETVQSKEGEWEVVPEEPAPEPSPPAPAKRASGAAPPLATRPTDPAAPPADAMAVAAKWAEEDEEALEDLADGTSSTAGRRGRLSRTGSKKPAPKAAKAVAKPAKKSKK